MKDQIEIIQDWLTSPLYWKGVEIYETYGESNFLKKLFRKSEDDYNREELNSALLQLLEVSVVEEAEVVENMPESLRGKLDVAKRLMDERTALKERLRVYYHQNASQELSKAVAFNILDINSKLNEIYDEERFYKSTGYLPERAEHEGDSVKDLYTRRNTLRTYLSREKDTEKLEKFKKELFSVEKKIEVLMPNVK